MASANNTPTLDTFLSGLASLLRANDAEQLRSYLLVEPPLPPVYAALVQEVQQAFPAAADNSSDALEKKCSDLLNSARRGGGPLSGSREGTPADGAATGGGAAWPAFKLLVKDYLIYLRDVNLDNLLKTHEQLSGVVK